VYQSQKKLYSLYIYYVSYILIPINFNEWKMSNILKRDNFINHHIFININIIHFVLICMVKWNGGGGDVPSTLIKTTPAIFGDYFFLWRCWNMTQMNTLWTLLETKTHQNLITNEGKNIIGIWRNKFDKMLKWWKLLCTLTPK
jgi:hypothetical protein